MSAPESALLTPAEYLAIERKAEIKHEYINGRMYAMSPGVRDAHDHIVTNLLRVLLNQTHGRPCRVFTADMRVKVSPTGMYTYADVAALCGEPRFEDAEVDVLLNPSVIVEVLSPSTAAYDRGEKFAHYTRLESLRECALVSQNRMRVEHFVRAGTEWRLSYLSDPQASLRFAPIGCEITLAEIYEGVELPPIENSRWPR